MPVNPLGAVQVSDFGNPKVITCIAREVISGGQFVTGSTATGVVNSGLSSFISSDMQVYVNGSGAEFTGIALATVGSNSYVPVAVEGIFILPCRAIISGGQMVSAAGDDTVAWGTIAGQQIGRCLIAGASGAFGVVHVRA